MKKRMIFTILIIYCLYMAIFTGCGDSGSSPPSGGNEPTSKSKVESSSEPLPSATTLTDEETPSSTTLADEETPAASSPAGTRDHTITVLTPTASGTAESHNDVASIDFSNAAEGYIMVRYTGSNNKVKLQVTGSSGPTYNYDLKTGDYAAFPLSQGSGTYKVGIYENTQGTSYSVCLVKEISVTISNEFGAFLYPNQYVNFTSSSLSVVKAAELAEGASSDLDVVVNVYNYVIDNITYDYAKAETVPSGYVSDLDEIMESKTGICLDYAAIMSSMLRSQGIPTRLDVGYAQDAYHAWISTYIKDIGWVNGIIYFDGKIWTLMDPTFGASVNESALKKYIGDGTNYTLQKMY